MTFDSVLKFLSCKHLTFLGEHAIAVGVLGVPSADRNPHVLVATSPAAQHSIKDLEWKPWPPAAKTRSFYFRIVLHPLNILSLVET